MKTQKTLNCIVALVGVWEIVAAFILGYSSSSAAIWDAILLGVAVAVLGGWAAMTGKQGTIKALEWVNVCLGVWLIVAPFLLGYSSLAGPLWNDIITGIVVVLLEGWALYALGRIDPN